MMIRDSADQVIDDALPNVRTRRRKVVTSASQEIKMEEAMEKIRTDKGCGCVSLCEGEPDTNM